MPQKIKTGIKPVVLAMTFLKFTLFIDITGWIWHGLLGQPSIINLVYFGFWYTPKLLILGLIGSLIYAFIAGYVFALIYNWVSKKY